MKVDANTPIGDLLAAVAYDAVLPADVAAQNAARAELARRSELAAKYERLTQTLAGLKRVTVSTDMQSSPCVLTATGLTMVFYAPLVLTDMSGEGIAAAIIAAAEGKQ